MSFKFTALSGYRIVWVWAVFDLPVLSREERKDARDFRNSLLDHGFEMVQFSVYSRYCASKEKAEALAGNIADIVPENGKVDLLFFTDRQYEQIKSFRGNSSNPLAEKPSQYLLF